MKYNIKVSAIETWPTAKKGVCVCVYKMYLAGVTGTVPNWKTFIFLGVAL